MSAYTIHQELFPPQTVEQVERCRFTSPEAVNLVVAKASLLQIYEFVEYVPEQPQTKEPEEEEDEEEPKALAMATDLSSGRLELVAQYKLNGTIATMGVVRTTSPRGKEGCDSLLVGFNDAKMSLLEWSPSTNSIVTVSIHYYERDEYKKEFLTNPYPPNIHIDPQQRCAVLNFYDNKLAVLPFRQSEKLDNEKQDVQEEDGEAQKWPYSPSFLIDLESIDPRIKNVIDMTFLSDYYEPTLAILFQTNQTWTGRLGSLKDTVSVVVVSLDLTAKIYPIIYSLDNLPYDCIKLVAMPKPVTGVLVIAANALLHVSQGSPGVGVAVNGYVKKMSDFHGMINDEKEEELNLSLDGAKAMAFGGDKCFLFLQDGTFATVKMKMDGSKVVGMEIRLETGILASVPSCVASIKQDYFFLGSRVGDSLLIKWEYNNKSEQQQRLQYKVCDTLLNTGPILDMAIGDVESNQKIDDDDVDDVQGKNVPDLELATCSGHGKNGSLCVFQRHVHPQTSFSFNQSGCQALWSIKCRKERYMQEKSENSHWETVEKNSSFEDAFDKLLFISKTKSTMVLSAGDELQELVKTGFYTRGPTIAVSTLFDATRIVQVHATGVMVLTPEGKKVQNFPCKHAKIVDASIQDPYIILTLDNHKMLALQGDPTTKNLISVQLPSYIKEKKVMMTNIFADTSGLFVSIGEKLAAKQKKKRKAEQEEASASLYHPNKKTSPPPIPESSLNATGDFDEVDMDLYGDQVDDQQEKTVDDMSTPIKSDTPPIADTVMAETKEDEDEEMLYASTHIKPEEIDEVNVSLLGGGIGFNEITLVSYWCLVYAEGQLQIYSLPDFKECFHFPYFDLLPDLLTDKPAHSTAERPSNKIQELLMTNIGKERKDPHLVARTDTNDIVIYKAFSFIDHDDDIGRLALRFSRVHHEYVSRKSSEEKRPMQKREIVDEFQVPDADLDDEEDEDIVSEKKNKTTSKLLIPFNDVAGYAGVFVAGEQPAWLMCSCKSFVRVHPMKTDQEVIGFTQFHNVNCQHGFITVDAKSTIRLSRLRTEGVNYDLDWVIQKVPLGQTVHKVEYHPVMRVYAVLVSNPEPVRLRNDDNQYLDGEEEERLPGEFLPRIDKFSMLMISPVTWETVDRVEFEEFEQCFSLQCAALESKQTSTGRKHFMVVGTGSLRGEDTTMRGSIRIYDIIEVVPEPNNPQTNHKFKHLHTEDVKGAVTAMCNVSGHLASCIGSKVIIWSFEDDESLVGVAFIDVQIYVTSMNSIKNFILLGDAQKSIWFLGFQLEPAKLALLGKDYQSFEVGCVDFILDDKSLYLLVGDTNENLDIYQYAPFNLQSFGGQKLMRRGDFHVGSQVQTMIRLPQIEKTENGFEYSRRHFCLCGTFSGSISMISPISEKTFKRLSTLYGQLVNGLQHVAGLNPRAYRLIKGPKQRMSSNRTKAVLDGDLIFEFAGLSVDRQKETTKQIGTTVARIMEDLVDIERSIDHF
ncbi:hypothetical protein K501DRAFT_239493 [Backusella circina FSU 941]|nr:hypothetical protein K501DRAFT_239493 [Backusella circina FSU 941]